jgi:hypothetical protein
MANMAYCRFQNTVEDLQDCYDTMNSMGYDSDLSENEKYARDKLVSLCAGIVSTFEE